MLVGEDIVVARPTTTYDEDRNPQITWAEEYVSDVLVAPGATNDLVDASRPDGIEVAFTLGFPKTYNKPLRGCNVFVRGEAYKVVGDPQPPTMANCPTKWWLTVEVARDDG